eukprot:2481373-Rhodomonas_salina.1
MLPVAWNKSCAEMELHGNICVALQILSWALFAALIFVPLALSWYHGVFGIRFSAEYVYSLEQLFFAQPDKLILMERMIQLPSFRWLGAEGRWLVALKVVLSLVASAVIGSQIFYI